LTPILKDIYDLACDLFQAGIIDRDKLREFYELVYQNHLTDAKLEAICAKLLRDRK
jgi:hypothetical protein